MPVSDCRCVAQLYDGCSRRIFALLEDRHQHAEEFMCSNHIEILARYMCAVWCAPFTLIHPACLNQCHRYNEQQCTLPWSITVWHAYAHATPHHVWRVTLRNNLNLCTHMHAGFWALGRFEYSKPDRRWILWPECHQMLGMRFGSLAKAVTRCSICCHKLYHVFG